MISQTHSGASSPDGNPVGDEQLVTQVCYLPYDDAGPESNGDQRLGLRAVEPVPNAKHAIRGNLYVLIELVQPAQQQAAIYSTTDLHRISERLLGLVQTTYYTAQGAQSAVMERAINQVDQALQQINHEQPRGTLRAGITCASLLKNKLTIACSGPALALIASDSALEQFPWHRSAPDVTLGGSQQPEVHTYRRQVGGNISLFIGTNRWLDRLTVRKLLGTVAPATVDDCDEIAAYLSEQAGEALLPGMLIAAALPALDDPALEQAPPQTASKRTANPSIPAPTGTAPTGTSPTGTVSKEGVPQPPASQQPESQQSQSRNTGIRNPFQRTRRSQKPSSSLPTAVNASPPVVRAPENVSGEGQDGDTTLFDQTQEMEPAVEFRPGPSQARRAKQEPARSEQLTHSQQPPDTENYQYTRAGAAERHSNDPSAIGTGAQQAGPSSPNAYADDSAVGGIYSEPHSLHPKPGPAVRQEPREPLVDRLRGAVAPQIGQLRAFFKNILPSSELKAPPKSPESTSRASAFNRYDEHPQSAEFDASPLGSEALGIEQTGSAPQQHVYSPPPPATGSRARVIISLAILLAFLIFAVVYVAVWRQGIASMERAEELITAAEGHLNNARASLVDGNDGNARVSLQRAQGYLIDAEQLGGPTNEIDKMMVDIRQELQKILQVTPLYGLISPLVTFPIEAEPHRVLVVDQDIYILDIGQDQILRYRLDETRSIVPDQAGSVVLKQGQNVEGINVGPLVDIAWQAPIPGVMDKANLLVLDSNNSIFRYNQRVDGAALQTFGDQASWQTPTQIQTYIGRFYVSDGGRGQIYRYEPGAYDQPPQPWLLVPQSSAVSSLASMMIDGDIWLLFNEGLLFRYNQGEQQPFELENDVGRITEPVDLFVGTQENSLIYLADAGEERILVFAKDGTYIQQLQAAEGNPLQELRGIFIDETSRTIYMLTRRGLFQHPLVE